MWYEYKNHKWFEIDSGNTLRLLISKKMHDIYMKKAHDIIGSGSLLSIGINEAKRLLTEEKELQVEITIRNLKEEAKDEDIESGVSDGE